MQLFILILCLTDIEKWLSILILNTIDIEKYFYTSLISIGIENLFIFAKPCHFLYLHIPTGIKYSYKKCFFTVIQGADIHLVRVYTYTNNKQSNKYLKRKIQKTSNYKITQKFKNRRILKLHHLQVLLVLVSNIILCLLYL